MGGSPGWVHLLRGQVDLHRGRFREAVGHLEQATTYNAGNEDPLLGPYIGGVYTHLGNIEEAIIWFERATETPAPVNGVSAIWSYDNSAIWNHPRFQTLMEKMNLDDASVATAKAAVASH